MFPIVGDNRIFYFLHLNVMCTACNLKCPVMVVVKCTHTLPSPHLVWGLYLTLQVQKVTVDKVSGNVLLIVLKNSCSQHLLSL